MPVGLSFQRRCAGGYESRREPDRDHSAAVGIFPGCSSRRCSGMPGSRPRAHRRCAECFWLEIRRRSLLASQCFCSSGLGHAEGGDSQRRELDQKHKGGHDHCRDGHAGAGDGGRRDASYRRSSTRSGRSRTTSFSQRCGRRRSQRQPVRPRLLPHRNCGEGLLPAPHRQVRARVRAAARRAQRASIARDPLRSLAVAAVAVPPGRIVIRPFLQGTSQVRIARARVRQSRPGADPGPSAPPPAARRGRDAAQPLQSAGRRGHRRRAWTLRRYTRSNALRWSTNFVGASTRSSPSSGTTLRRGVRRACSLGTTGIARRSSTESTPPSTHAKGSTCIGRSSAFRPTPVFAEAAFSRTAGAAPPQRRPSAARSAGAAHSLGAAPSSSQRLRRPPAPVFRAAPSTASAAAGYAFPRRLPSQCGGRPKQMRCRRPAGALGLLARSRPAARPSSPSSLRPGRTSARSTARLTRARVQRRAHAWFRRIRAQRSPVFFGWWPISCLLGFRAVVRPTSSWRTPRDRWSDSSGRPPYPRRCQLAHQRMARQISG